MKTIYTPETVSSFLDSIRYAKPMTLQQLTEGHLSQAFSFETDSGNKQVLRISDNISDFLADKYAADHFGGTLPIPKVTDINRLDPTAYYCISDFCKGKTSNTLTDEELSVALPAIQQALADTFRIDIVQSHGYGPIDTTTGNAPYESWKSALGESINIESAETFKRCAQNIGLDPNIIDKFFAQFHDKIPYASESRRLLHGDPSFDNILIEGSEVTALIDWGQMGYGDWVSDFARLEFWWPGRHGDMAEFAKQYQLDDKNLDQRKALYWATNALWAIEFADKSKNEQVIVWIKEHIDKRLI